MQDYAAGPGPSRFAVTVFDQGAGWPVNSATADYGCAITPQKDFCPTPANVSGFTQLRIGGGAGAFSSVDVLALAVYDSALSDVFK